MALSDEELVKYFQGKTKTSDDIRGRKICIFSDQGIGKTVLAAKLGTSNLFVTDEEGILSLRNHPELDEKSSFLIFDGDDMKGLGYKKLAMLLNLCEKGIYEGRNGLPVDNVILDTVSGIVQTEIARSVIDGDINFKDEKAGRLAANIPAMQHYLLSEQNFLPLMRMIAQMHNCSVTLLSHLRTGDKSVPGAATRPDMHGAVYKAMAKYVSVMGYMHLDTSGQRMIRVNPGQMISAKSRLNFGKSILTDTEFVTAITNWKMGK